MRTEHAESPKAHRRRPRAASILRHVGLFIVALLLFALALVMMREGAGALADGFDRILAADSPASALGFGWLFASLALSGSPVAATALSLLDAGVLTTTETFAMIAGSRLGAAFIVLVVGFVHLLRGRHRTLSLGAGLLSLLVTQTTYLFVLPLGLFLLSRGWLNVAWSTTGGVASPFELILDPVVAWMTNLLPAWTLFPAGFLLLLPSFRLFDAALPHLHLEATPVAGLNRLLYRPVVAFLLGALLTSLTLSVSVSLSLLVPLSARGYIRQENVIPYVMGANITTFDDTLVAAALLGNPAAVSVVLVQMASVAIVCLAILVLAYRPYQRLISRMAAAIGATPGRLTVYVVLMFALPTLLLFGGLR